MLYEQQQARKKGRLWEMPSLGARFKSLPAHFGILPDDRPCFHFRKSLTLPNSHAQWKPTSISAFTSSGFWANLTVNSSLGLKRWRLQTQRETGTPLPLPAFIYWLWLAFVNNVLRVPVKLLLLF
jgi:hypothetical protein